MNRRGFTLIELLVVIAIIAVLVGLLLPAVQKVREASNRSKCLNNQRQIALATHAFEGSRGHLPPYALTTPTQHGFVTQILPQLEQENLYRRYSFDVHFYDPANRPVVTTPLRVTQCPSSPEQDRLDEDPINYWPVSGVKTAAADYALVLGVYFAVAPRPDYEGGIGYTGRKPKVADITDGTSGTLFYAEIAGRPKALLLGKPRVGRDWQPFSGWADVNCNFNTNEPVCGQQVINCNNDDIYAFHPGGAVVAFLDGSVRFLSESTTPDVLTTLVTRQAGDVGGGE